MKPSKTQLTPMILGKLWYNLVKKTENHQTSTKSIEKNLPKTLKSKPG